MTRGSPHVPRSLVQFLNLVLEGAAAREARRFRLDRTVGRPRDTPAAVGGQAAPAATGPGPVGPGGAVFSAAPYWEATPLLTAASSSEPYSVTARGRGGEGQTGLSTAPAPSAGPHTGPGLDGPGAVRFSHAEPMGAPPGPARGDRWERHASPLLIQAERAARREHLLDRYAPVRAPTAPARARGPEPEPKALRPEMAAPRSWQPGWLTVTGPAPLGPHAPASHAPSPHAPAPFGPHAQVAISGPQFPPFAGPRPASAQLPEWPTSTRTPAWPPSTGAAQADLREQLARILRDDALRHGLILGEG